MKRFLKHLISSPKAGGRRPDRQARLGVETLEERQLLSFGGLFAPPTAPLTSAITNQPASLSPSLLSTPPLDVGGVLDTNAGQVLNFGSVVGTSSDMASELEAIVPALSSNSGASHTLYLNFGGDERAQWSGKDPNGNTWTFPDVNVPYHPKDITTLPFERVDNSPLTDRQRAQITEIWARVAEAYAPFDVNVTTVDPGNLDDGKTLMVNIGMSNDWFTGKLGATGISDIGNFTDPYPNIDFVFLEHIPGISDRPDVYNDPGFAEQIANTVSHEAGHSFGLLHHQILNPDGTLQYEYDPGAGNFSPIMGDPLKDTRHTWGIGMTGEVGLNDDGSISYDDRRLQVDTNILGSVLGFRTFNVGHDIASATPLSMIEGTGTAQGVVGLKPFDLFGPVDRDVDVFSFDNTFAGRVTVRANVLGYHNGSNLNARIELWSQDGFIASANPYDDQGNAKLTETLAPGTYYVKIMGVDNFDAGQYTLTVTAPSSFGRVATQMPSDGSKVGTLGGDAVKDGQINGFAPDSTAPLAALAPDAQPVTTDALAGDLQSSAVTDTSGYVAATSLADPAPDSDFLAADSIDPAAATPAVADLSSLDLAPAADPATPVQDTLSLG